MTWKASGFILLFFSLSILTGCGGSAGSGNQGGGKQNGSLSLALSNNAPLVFPSQNVNGRGVCETAIAFSPAGYFRFLERTISLALPACAS